MIFWYYGGVSDSFLNSALPAVAVYTVAFEWMDGFLAFFLVECFLALVFRHSYRTKIDTTEQNTWISSVYHRVWPLRGVPWSAVLYSTSVLWGYKGVCIIRWMWTALSGLCTLYAAITRVAAQLVCIAPHILSVWYSRYILHSRHSYEYECLAIPVCRNTAGISQAAGLRCTRAILV